MTAAATAAAAPAEASETPLQRFEREIAEKYPRRYIKRYEMPSKIRQCRAVYLIELTSRDTMQAAIYADAKLTTAQKSSIKMTTEVERFEAMRASVVGVVRRTDPPRYDHVNGAVPFEELSDWPETACSSLLAYFSEINGVSSTELLEGMKGARVIGAFAPPPLAPTDATPK
jgi:hypothetical protein